MELKITTDIKGLEELIKQYPEASKKARISRITEACAFLENRLKLAPDEGGHTPRGAGMKGHYFASIFHKVEYGQKIELGTPIRGIVTSPFEYGEALEYGRSPGKYPPRKPIQAWVEKKLEVSGKEAKAVAFLVARKIAKQGTKGAHMYEKTLEENKERVISILNKIPEDIVNGLKK